MADDANRKLVLVTGGTGFVAGWTIVALLKAGYRVRATLRSFARETEARSAIAAEAGGDSNLTFVETDLMRDAGWDQAAEGADFVLHIASPMQVGEFRDQDVIRPAREGTLRVLKAAAKAGVQRTVITSSTQAALPAVRSDIPADETIWTDLTRPRITDYIRAKTLAEKDAWSFAAQNPAMEVASVLPAFIQGPLIGRDISGSIEVVWRLLKGQVAAIPRIGFAIVDVRDLADLHLRAMTAPEGAGQRFIGAGAFLWFADFARLLRERLGEAAGRVPSRIAPDLLIRVSALFQKDLRQLTPNLGKKQLYSSAKAERLLGWKTRPAETSILDAAQSLIRAGLVSA